MINFEEEIERFRPSLEVEAVSEAIVKSDLTDMSDIMLEDQKGKVIYGYIAENPAGGQ